MSETRVGLKVDLQVVGVVLGRREGGPEVIFLLFCFGGQKYNRLMEALLHPKIAFLNLDFIFNLTICFYVAYRNLYRFNF